MDVRTYVYVALLVFRMVRMVFSSKNVATCHVNSSSQQPS
eukprot:COSAG06_NODE_5759_length_3288_cov_52.533082_1_plen_39_part_10